MTTRSRPSADDRWSDQPCLRRDSEMNRRLRSASSVAASTRIVRRLAVWCLPLMLMPAVAGAQAPAETTEYYGQDAIGSIRIVFDVSGTVLARQDYAPFGKPLFSAPAMPKEGFGAQETDAETDQSYFHARMFQARTGRLTRPDPIPGTLFDPQLLNRYAYARNSPLAFSDFDGLDPVTFKSGTVFCKDWTKSDESGYAETCPAQAGLFDWDPIDGILSGFTPRAGEGGSTGRDHRGRGDTGNGNPRDPTRPPEDRPASPPKAEDCKGTATPDFVRFQFSVGFVLGGTISLAMDRFGNGYVGIGPSVGRGVPFGLSTTVGWVGGVRNQANTISTLSRSSLSAGGSLIPLMSDFLLLGGSISTNQPWSHGATYEVGLFSPQLGVGYSYSWVSTSGNSCP
jgi:RHS repeat-associated protein